MCDDRDREDRLSAFDTSALLRVADDLDEMREHLDGDGYKPPEIRDDMLRLHQLAMRVDEGRLYRPGDQRRDVRTGDRPRAPHR